MIKLMPHQNETLCKTESFDRVAYYLDMGLGKTYVGSEKLWELNTPVNLVICQKNKVSDWMEHFLEHYTQDNFSAFDLTKKKELDEFFRRIENGVDDISSVVGIVNYETAFRRKILANLEGFTLMLDESSLIQNERAKRSKFILKMKPQNVILLSGTPTAGKYEKLWSQCKLLGWDISKKAFYNSYVVTKWIEIGQFRHEIVTGYKNVEHLKQKLREYGAVFMKSEDVVELPRQVEQNIYLPVTNEYKRFRKNAYVQFSDVEIVGDNSLTKILGLRQLCGQYHKEKLNRLKELVESTEKRILIFYNFNQELLEMEKILKYLNRPYSYMNGGKKDMDAYENNDSSITFIQYQSGARGGNYQKANIIIYFTLPLGKGSCELWEQSKKRIHRIGQKNSCFYYYLLCKNSYEVENLKNLKEGRDYTNELFNEES